jgi:hypothetical protein
MKPESSLKKNDLKERQEAFNFLPPHTRQSLTEEEIHIFLYEETWPETLCEKLKDFLVKTP